MRAAACCRCRRGCGRPPARAPPPALGTALPPAAQPQLHNALRLAAGVPIPPGVTPEQHQAAAAAAAMAAAAAAMYSPMGLVMMPPTMPGMPMAGVPPVAPAGATPEAMQVRVAVAPRGGGAVVVPWWCWRGRVARRGAAPTAC